MMTPLDQHTSIRVRYESSVRTLLDLALDNNDEEARIAADVLLSANGTKRTPYSRWKVQIGDLARLSDNLFAAAIGVIYGRSELHLYPAHVIQDGYRLFKRLKLRWRNVEDW